MNTIHDTRGDATIPVASTNKINCHICNDLGQWGLGFVMAISGRWPHPEATYRKWHRSKYGDILPLGEPQFVQVANDIWIANRFGLEGIQRKQSRPPIRYPAVQSCLTRVHDVTLNLRTSVHMPRIGSGLAEGEWSATEEIIITELSARNLRVTVYDL